MVNIPDDLYDNFVKKKDEMDSLLSTIDILKDKKLLEKIQKANLEILENNSTEVSFEDIDSL